MGDSFYKLGGVYSIIHIGSGRLYIGSALFFYKRWSEHRIKLSKNIHPNKRLQNFWNKYGKENFKFEIIEVIKSPTKELLEQREQYWIDYYKSSDRNLGFNIRKISSSNLGFKHSDETKQKMRLAHLGKKQSSEHIKNAAASHRGKKRTEEQAKRCAHGWTDEQKRRQSEILKQYWANNSASDSMKQKCSVASLKRWAKSNRSR